MKGYIVKLRNGKLHYHLITPYGGTIAASLGDTKRYLDFGTEWTQHVSYPDYSSKRKIKNWYSSDGRGRIVGVFHV